MSTVTNEIGQKISPGDRVAYTYYNGTWTPLVGKFLGLTYAGQVRIESETIKDPHIRRKWDGKVFPYDYGKAWARRPGNHYIQKGTGLLIEYERWWKLPANERSGWEYDRNGLLAQGYELFEVPAIRTGPAGLKRTFKLEK